MATPACPSALRVRGGIAPVSSHGPVRRTVTLDFSLRPQRADSSDAGSKGLLACGARALGALGAGPDLDRLVSTVRSW